MAKGCKTSIGKLKMLKKPRQNKTEASMKVGERRKKGEWGPGREATIETGGRTKKGWRGR